jgi:glycerol-3-phosphate dehydrogenase subunit B
MLHPTIGGRVVENAWAIGSLLAGADSVSEGSGGGVAVLTALAVADQIGNKEQK